ncbi:caprin homolog [Orussus abietinus]|uniref:caprin homolog n=1 Tax=Orussus abietinus TaxID=222816 RepID=UPI000626B2DF|nr:caprin homolog [Orussus abietinus]
MPSANPKLEKQASTEAVEPIRQAIVVIEHKIRNLEKRKGKLESYRDLQKNGKELNQDQKIAVAKYDEVQQTLDITRELYRQIVGIANDAAKQQKKMARKEAMERMQQDIAKVREVLLIQNTLLNMGVESAREDFLAGANGAAKLTDDDLKYLDDLYVEVTLKRERAEGEPTSLQQAQKIAEHFVAIVDGKPREIVGTTYNKIKEIIVSINQCGYFDQVHEVEVQIEEMVEAVAETQLLEAPAQEPINEEYNSGERHIPPPEAMIPIPSFPVQVTLPVVSGAAPVSGPIPVVPQPIPPHPTAPVETSYYTSAPNFVPQPQAQQQPQPPQPQPQPQQQQQQQQQPPPPPQQTQQQQQPPQPPRINDVIGTPNFFFLQESELDSPDIATQPPIVSHIPPTVNAPIPTQTFTNQNFANPGVVPQQVMYQHQQPPPPPPQDMAHIPGFANPNPPPPIPMPPSHQQPGMPYSPQHPAGFQQRPPPPAQAAAQMQQQQVQGQGFDQTSRTQEPQLSNTEVEHSQEKGDQGHEEPVSGEAEIERTSESADWCEVTDRTGNQSDLQQNVQESHQQPQQQPSQQAWGEQQRGGYRGRGGRRGSSNGYNGRGRGGNYQQNGRGGGGQGSYYRADGNYQNGYQPRSYNNDGNSGYNGGFKRGTGGPRGGPRGDRGTGERGGRGQFRGGQKSGNRGGYAPRGKPQQAQQQQ